MQIKIACQVATLLQNPRSLIQLKDELFEIKRHLRTQIFRECIEKQLCTITASGIAKSKSLELCYIINQAKGLHLTDFQQPIRPLFWGAIRQQVHVPWQFKTRRIHRRFVRSTTIQENPQFFVVPNKFRL